MAAEQPLDLERLLSLVRERSQQIEPAAVPTSAAEQSEPRPPLVSLRADGALESAARVARDLDVDYRFGWQTRWLGPLWVKIRQWVHREVRIYTDGIIGKQQQYNEATLDVARQLVAAVSALNANVAALNAQAARLERLVRDLDGEAAALEGEMSLLTDLRAAVEDVRARIGALDAGPGSRRG